MIVLAQTRDGLTGGRTRLADGLEVRSLEAADRRRVTAVVDEWWGRPMGGLLPRPFFSEFGETSFIVEREGELVAFLVGFLSQSSPDDAYIHAVGVAPAWRERGLARLLYERFLDVARRHGRIRIRAITSPVNTASIAFHRRLGFAVQMPTEVEGERGRVQFLLELLEPTSIDLEANVEAKLLMLERAFELGFRRVEFKTDARNVRSRRALEALPAQFEGVFRKHMLVRRGQRRDSAYYSVIDDDWPQVRANLERRLEKHRQRQEGETRT